MNVVSVPFVRSRGFIVLKSWRAIVVHPSFVTTLSVKAAMGDAPTLDCVLESARHMFLADDIRHLPGSPFSRKYFVCHASYYIKKGPKNKGVGHRFQLDARDSRQ